LFSLSNSAYRCYVNSVGNIGVNSTLTSADLTEGYHEIAVEFNTEGIGVAVAIDGVISWTGVASPAGQTSNGFYIGARDNSGIGLFWKGLIYDFSITGSSVKNFSLNGYGNTDADWIDTTGTVDSNDITVNGSPESYYIPAAQNGLDALGQALTDPFIDGKRNRAETEYAYNPDSTPEMSNIYTESVFNGSSSNGYVSNDSVMNFTDNLTVTCWAKSDLTDISSSADTLVSMFEDSGDLEVWRMEISTDEKLRFQIGNAGGTGATIETADSAHPIDNWNHYAATFDGGVVKLYINGELQGSSESSAHASTLNGRSAPLVLGAYFWTGGGGSFQEWDGSLRNVRVYEGDSRPMNSEEINKDLYETDYQPRFEGQTVIASYDLVKDTIDRSGNGLHATNTGITFTKKTVPSAMGFGDDLGEDGIVTKTVKFNDNGWGAVFDGSSEIVVGNREKLKIDANPFEIECALKTSDAGDNTILSKYQTSGNLRSYSLNVESGKVVFHSSSNGTAVTSATGSIDVDDGSWHRIKIQKESESGTSLKMFVDGTEDGSVAGSVAANLSSNISNVAIGAYNTDATSANVFTGTLRDLSVKKNGVEVAHWELAKDTRDSTPNEYHGMNDGVTFLAPDEESSITILDRYPLGKTSQFLKQYNKSRLYENN
jgi:hypothetical protein